MNFKLFSILLIISVYTEATQHNLKRKKIKHETLEDSIRNDDPDDVRAKLTRTDVNLLIDIIFSEDDNSTKTELLAIDTTSSDLWVVSPGCTSTFCKGKTGENGNSTENKESTAENGLVRGVEGDRAIQIGSLVVGIVKFTAADYVDRAVEKRLSSDATGALGLGPDNVLINATQPQNLMCLQVSPSHGTLYVSEIPKSVPSGKRFRIKTKSKTSWRISLGYVSTSVPPFKNWCTVGCDAEIDTTFSGISGPAKDINDLNAYLGAEEDGSIDCYKKNMIEHLVFHINGQRYNLEAKNFIVQEDREKDPYSNKCKSLFQVEYSYNGAWRLGLAFLQQFSTVFELSEDKDPYNQHISFVPRH